MKYKNNYLIHFFLLSLKKLTFFYFKDVFMIDFLFKVIQFHTVWHYENQTYINNNGYNYENIIYQPYLSYIHYYNIENKKGEEYIYALWNKLIKREIAKKIF